MTRLKMIASSLLVASAAGLMAYPVFAALAEGHNTAADGKKIAAQLDQNKTTLAKAVADAEEHTKGRAISVISDLNDKDQVAVHVFCIVGDPPKIMKCYFDHATGSVKGMKEVEDFPISESDHGHAPGHAEGRDHPDHGKRDHADDHAHDAPAGDNHAKHHDPDSVKMIKSQTLEVACGACIYKMASVEGCPLAIKIDGKPYLVEGATWPNHDYCDRTCQAVVTGKLQGDKFIATSLEPKK